MEKPGRKHKVHYSRHADDRRKERFGKDFNFYNQLWMAEKIQSGKTVFLRRSYRKSVSLHALKTKKGWMVVVWHKYAKKILTVREPNPEEAAYLSTRD